MTDTHKTTEQMILPTSPEAATYRTDIKGWVSRDGRFYGDGPSSERTARYAGSTHSICQRCGAPCEKSWLACRGCRDLLDHERWEKLDLVEWHGEPLTLFCGDEYFFDAESVYDYADTHDLKVSEMDLVVCVPNCAHEVDPEYWSDALPEDVDELPDWLTNAVERLNRTIRQHAGEPLSWSAGKQRVILPDNQEAAA